MGTSSARQPATVVFDVGKVLIEWDPRHLYRKVFDDPERMEWFLENVCSNAWNLEQDRGRPWPLAEQLLIDQHPDWAEEIRLFRRRWREMVPYAVDDSVAVLQDLLDAGVPLYAITNFAADTFREAQDIYPFLTRFRGIVCSGEIGAIKPDPVIYRRLAEVHGVDLRTALFIDDSQRNVDGSKAAGMPAILFTDGSTLRRDLRKLGLAV